jgi:hypothetical protein
MALCTYHELYLWSDTPDCLHSSSPKFNDEIEKACKDPQQPECHLCSLFAEAPEYMDRLVALTFDFESSRLPKDPKCIHTAQLHPPVLRMVAPRDDIDLKADMSNFHILDMDSSGLEHGQELKSRQVPSYIDYEVLLDWLKICQSNHTDSCGQLGSKTIPGLKVIDCHTRCVVDAPSVGCDFAALSYVWGDTSPTRMGFTEFPPTIEDAIIVTIALRIRYLWVDQYVRINQKDSLAALYTKPTSV